MGTLYHAGFKTIVGQIKKKPNDTEWAAWADKWHRIYFDYRRPYEGWALFGIGKL